ncbi:pyroglutamyl-peptidase I Cysteine peptidase. MEROPS family C15 [Duganella sp. CF458]|uniref:pyroglutamyl-peptidase I n=1 Tax=Duganella sp. CF458 TaxID=1884368 RepID=UPI0008E43E67|nr:pyroglutamyl-peptidase I [Duganella sp. CF458]SFG02515.1 pyroglutamyl-peptidase I Cysteine peptidase. MEROPS family C15 [Duganella sp. CF458]
MKTVLLTGFEPFNKEPVNPAWETVRALDGWGEGDFRVVARQLPCVFGDANAAMTALIEELKPALVIAVGQAGGRVDLSVERVAINVDDAPIKDNAEKQLVDEPIVRGGPAAYFATLPIKAIVAALRAAGLPASVSQTAGTFVCNHVFYGLMHAVAGRDDVKAGFIHIPYLPEQAARHPGTASMSLEQMKEGLRVAVRTAQAVDRDAVVAAGATH